MLWILIHEILMLVRSRVWAVFLLAPAVITVFLLVGLAMWTDELITIELEKTERGLGFTPIGSCCNNCIPIGRPGHVDG